MSLRRCDKTGTVDKTHQTWKQVHARKCVVINNPSLEPDDYPWDGRPEPEEPDDLQAWQETLGPNAGPSSRPPAPGIENAHPNHNVVVAPNVEEDMKLRVNELATNDLSSKRVLRRTRRPCFSFLTVLTIFGFMHVRPNNNKIEYSADTHFRSFLLSYLF